MNVGTRIIAHPEWARKWGQDKVLTGTIETVLEKAFVVLWDNGKSTFAMPGWVREVGPNGAAVEPFIGEENVVRVDFSRRRAG